MLLLLLLLLLLLINRRGPFEPDEVEEFAWLLLSIGRGMVMRQEPKREKAASKVAEETFVTSQTKTE
jgi:hypothetical protein